METNKQDPQTDEAVNLEDVSRTLLRIVALLPKTEHSTDKPMRHDDLKVEENKTNNAGNFVTDTGNDKD